MADRVVVMYAGSVVETADAVLVADRNRVQDVKRIVSQLKDQDRPEVSLHRQVYRPWGSYESLISSERFQVKRIVVSLAIPPDAAMHKIVPTTLASASSQTIE